MPLKIYPLKDFIHTLITKEIKILLILLIISAGILAFIGIGNIVSKGTTREFDITVIESLRTAGDISRPVGPVWVKEFMNDITSLGGGSVLALITVLVSVLLILQKNYDEFWLVLAATIGGALISFWLKDIYDRERPDLIYRLVTVTSYSFPSGHSMMSAVIYLTQAAVIARFQKEMKIKIYILIAAMFLTFIIGLSRIYLGVHYPTDVLGGWIIGLAWASLCWIVTWYLQGKRKLKPDVKG